MTDNEIIKALECCSNDNIDCEECPANGLCDNDDYCFTGAILDLINRQQAEIERLKAENQSIKYCYERAKSYNDTLAESCEKNCKKFNMTTRAEAIKEFAERLKKRATGMLLMGEKFYSVDTDDIDELLAELTGETVERGDKK